VTITKNVLDALVRAPATAAAIADQIGADVGQVNTSLWSLQKRGLVAKEGEKRPFTWRLTQPWPHEAPTTTRWARTEVAAPEDAANLPEIMVGRVSGGDVQISVGEESLRMAYAAAREVHALLFDVFANDEAAS
jgi:hypothetical protein